MKFFTMTLDGLPQVNLTVSAVTPSNDKKYCLGCFSLDWSQKHCPIATSQAVLPLFFPPE
jgi:hypothetical protein